MSAECERGTDEPRKKRKYVIRPLCPAPARPDRSRLEEAAFAAFARSRRELIAEAAYYRAMRRAGGAGTPERDWFEAEAEIDERLVEAIRSGRG